MTINVIEILNLEQSYGCTSLFNKFGGGGSEGIVEESEGRIQVELNVSDLESSWHPKI